MNTYGYVQTQQTVDIMLPQTKSLPQLFFPRFIKLALYTSPGTEDMKKHLLFCVPRFKHYITPTSINLKR